MHFIEMMLSSVVFIGLILTWKDYNARWLFSLMLLLQLVDMTVNPITISWTRHYYLWCLVLNICFLALFLTRGVQAEALYKLTKIEFFKKARERYVLTIPECCICLLLFVASMLCLATWVEIQLYFYKVLSYPFIYHHVWSPTQYILHILESLTLITFIVHVRRSKGELIYENN